MKKSIICLLAAISIFCCAALPVNATDKTYEKLELYPGRSIQTSSDYSYGNKTFSITVPYNQIYVDEIGDVAVNNFLISSTVINDDDTISGTVGTDNVDLTVEKGDEVFKVTFDNFNIATSGTNSSSYVFNGKVSFSKLYTWLPDYTQIQNCDVAKIYMSNFGYTESLSSAVNGVVDSHSYVVDSLGNRFDLADGYNLIYYSYPGSSINIVTEVDFSVVIPAVTQIQNDGDFTFYINLDSNTPNGDKWIVEPLRRYTDYSSLLSSYWNTFATYYNSKIVPHIDGLEQQITNFYMLIYNNFSQANSSFWKLFNSNLTDILDKYWSEDNPVTSDKVNSGVTDYIAIENELSDSSFATVKDFDVNLYKFENMDSNFVTSVLWITTIMNSIFNNISGYNTVFVITCALLFACVLVGLSRLWK